MRRVILFLAIASLFGCEKEEKPVNPATSQALSAGMGSSYETMLYFNISTGLFVQETDHHPSDLQFPGNPLDNHIYLNSSNFMFVRNFGSVPFESVTDTSHSSDWKYDFPTGNPNRTAFGEWMDGTGKTKNEVFVVNRGTNSKGISIGFVKMQVLKVSPTAFEIRVANLDNTSDTVLTVQRDPNKVRNQFWFETMAIEDIEPEKSTWHLHFTQYTDYDITDGGDTIPYIVRGALINQTNTAAAFIDGVSFKDIKLADVQGLTFSNNRNAIGYNWKKFSLDSGVYEVVPDRVYIIKEIGGNYYKLQFLDYYNDAGEKGYAKFQIEGL